MKFFVALGLTLLLLPFPGLTQICTGSLGDPVVNYTFGTGPNPGASLPSRINNYLYTSAPCPGDGSYTIVSSTLFCWNNTWHSLSEDHTPGDENGYMMLVNSTFTPGDFYTDTVSGLCNNTTYEFATYVMNVLRDFACNGTGIKPNLTFKIETVSGTVLATYNSGDIAATSFPLWRQIGFFFVTPAGIDKVVLRLTNNAIGGCGNDLVLDDITFRPCGPQVSASIAVNGSPTLVSLCEGAQQRFTLNANVSSGYSNPIFQWQSSSKGGPWADIRGATTTSFTRDGNDTGDYKYRLAVAEPGNIASAACRIFSNTLTIRIDPIPRINISANLPICIGGKLALKANGGNLYTWTGPAGFTSTQSAPELPASFGIAGRYRVTVSTAIGCTAKDSIDITVFPQAFADAGVDQTICEGSAATLIGKGGADYRWTPANSLSSAVVQSPVARPADTTKYVLNVRDVNGCMATDSVLVFVLKKPFANAGRDTALFEGASAFLYGNVGGTAVTFSWSPATWLDDIRSLRPKATPADNITYILRTMSSVGCGVAEDEVFIRVYKKVVIPNAFSPNGDGINDSWNVEHLDNYPEATVNVFNRYGKEVFQSKAYPRPWNGSFDGKALPMGTYYYVVNLHNGLALLTGWVVILK